MIILLYLWDRRSGVTAGGKTTQLVEAFNGKGLPRAVRVSDRDLFECNLFVIYNQSRVFPIQNSIHTLDPFVSNEKGPKGGGKKTTLKRTPPLTCRRTQSPQLQQPITPGPLQAQQRKRAS
jgi:hypothetical protein